MGSPTVPGISTDIAKRAAVLAVCLSLGVCSSCAGAQSALDPAGEEARQIAQLLWLMATAGGFIWLAVVALLVHATRRERVPMPFAVWNSIAAVAEFVPGAPIQRNQVDLMRVDNVAAIDLPGLRQVGIEPRDILEVIGMIEHTGD